MDKVDLLCFTRAFNGGNRSLILFRDQRQSTKPQVHSDVRVWIEGFAEPLHRRIVKLLRPGDQFKKGHPLALKISFCVDQRCEVATPHGPSRAQTIEFTQKLFHRGKPHIRWH